MTGSGNVSNILNCLTWLCKVLPTGSDSCYVINTVILHSSDGAALFCDMPPGLIVSMNLSDDKNTDQLYKLLGVRRQQYDVSRCFATFTACRSNSCKSMQSNIIA